MKKFFLPIVGALTILIIIGGVLLFSKEPPKSSPLPLPSSYEYFWGDGCPHCEVVEEFFSTWENRDKVKIDKKEVWSSAANAKVLQERASYCGVRPSEVGVPFLFTPEGKCLSGDQPIIDLFKNLDL
jgi:hypothetical protein